MVAVVAAALSVEPETAVVVVVVVALVVKAIKILVHLFPFEILNSK